MVIGVFPTTHLFHPGTTAAGRDGWGFRRAENPHPRFHRDEPGGGENLFQARSRGDQSHTAWLARKTGPSRQVRAYSQPAALSALILTTQEKQAPTPQHIA